MHPSVRQTLDNINEIEAQRRGDLAQSVLSFIGREFRRRFPKRKLSIRFVNGDEVIKIDDKSRDRFIDENSRAWQCLGFIYEHIDVVIEITEGYTRGCPDDLFVRPDDTRSMRYVRELNGINTDDPEAAHGMADEILLRYLRAIGHERVADAYDQVVERARWWGAA